MSAGGTFPPEFYIRTSTNHFRRKFILLQILLYKFRVVRDALRLHPFHYFENRQLFLSEPEIKTIAGKVDQASVKLLLSSFGAFDIFSHRFDGQ